MNKKFLFTVVALLALAALVVAVNVGKFSSRSQACESCGGAASERIIVGGDMDEHGCIGSAGYMWCESKQKCLRAWEEQCPSV